METPPLPPTRPDGSPWPRISIVTPSYNQGQFIEETIRSVLLQGYPDLEYIIIDGDSTDQSVEIIRRYEPWLTYWISEKDRGQAHAINKGLELSTGVLFQWINSDDLLLPSALRHVAQAFAKSSTVAAPILVGSNLASAKQLGSARDRSLTVCDMLTGKCRFCQQGVWHVRSRLKEVGINEQFHYSFDWDMAIRYIGKFPKVIYLQENVALFRSHSESKSASAPKGFERETRLIWAELAHTLESETHRALCRKMLRGMIWHRHLTDWHTRPPRPRRVIAARMLLLGLRRPQQRISRFWLGALRRALLS